MRSLTTLTLVVLSSLLMGLFAGGAQAQPRLPSPPSSTAPPPPPPPPPAPREFTLNVAVSGGGAVGGAVPIACPGACSAGYVEGTRLWLHATPRPDSIFAGWSGSCSGKGACALTMNQNHAVTANFVRPRLTVSRAGTGTGRVSSNPPGISDCGTDCDEVYPANAGITLTAHNGTGVFAGWRGPCAVVGGDCFVLMNDNKHVVAAFERPLLRVTAEGGRVTSSVAGIDCGGDCEERYDNGGKVTLTATPNSGFSFLRWEGDCESESGATCRVSMDKAVRNVCAVFDSAYAFRRPGPLLGGTGTTVYVGTQSKVELVAPTPSQAVAAGQPAGYTINIVRTNFNGMVSLSARVVNPAAGTRPAVSLSPVNTSGNTSTLNVSATAQTGTYTVEITGTATGVNIAPINVQLTVR